MNNIKMVEGLNLGLQNVSINGKNAKKHNNEDDSYPNKSVFNEPRHFEIIEGLKDFPNQNWRTKERMKTMSVAIVMCLNVGVDPPDVMKPNPCAVMQCWTDPFSAPPSKAAETIATKLIKQYERWQPRARYKHCIDPTIEDIKKLCNSLRRTSKEERVLFHYNGHGVPKPTINGEIWVFNRSFTQYIPLSLYDLQQWMGSPSIYVFDCSNAGVIVELFNQFAIQHQKEYEMNVNSSAYLGSAKEELNSKISPPPNYQNCILLAACDKGETLPLHPDLPADLFTSCLTTPIKTFLVWFMKRTSRKLAPNINIDLIDKIPGSLTDRKSILGELNWIFTAITDTIAWNTLPRELFQRLFRQDLLVASLFRNFLLAQRIMRSYDCSPVSHPAIKPVHHHPMWHAWDLAVDNCLSQLAQMDLSSKSTPSPYVPSQFFTEQLTAFQVWLKLSTFPSSTPEQLPIVLQVLLSQVHRSRALDLLGNFLNLGPWAVNLALSVGIFPYVLKLLQASARELRPFLVFIWAKILAIDESYQSDLIRENAHRYFMNILSDQNISVNHQVMSAFVLSVIVRHNPAGQDIVTQSGSNNPSGSIIDIAMLLLMDHQQDHPSLRKWLLICLANAWENNEKVRWLATRNAVYEKLYALLKDPVPEVRAATVYALGTFINSTTEKSEHTDEIDCKIASNLVLNVFYDCSPLVRKELLVTLHWFIIIFENMFLANFRKRAFEEHIKQQQQPFSTKTNDHEHSPQNSVDSTQSSIPSIMMNNSVTELANCNGSLTSTNMRKISSKDRLSSNFSIKNIFNSVSVSITVPANLSNAHQSSVNLQLTPPSSNANSMKRVSSVNSLLNYSTSSTFSVNSSKSLETVYSRVWQLIELYRTDPHPDVCKMANFIFNDIQSRAFTSREANSNSFNSESGSSPIHRASYLSRESPILASENDSEYTKSTSRTFTPVRETSKHHSGRVSVFGVSSPYLPHSNNHNQFMTQFTMKRTMFGRDPALEDFSEIRERNGLREARDSENQQSISLSELPSCRKPLVGTSFVDWCTKHFSQPCTHSGVCGCTNIELGQSDLVTEWRSTLLDKYYRKAKRELENIQNIKGTAGNEVILQRKNVDAHLLAFHPFEKCLAFANAHTFSVWNYGLPSDSEPIAKFSNDSSLDRITDLHLINTHEKALLMLASDNGSVKIWRDLLPTTFSNICPDDDSFSFLPQLSTAFFMFKETPTDRGNVILCWDQRKQRIIAGGEHKILRLWDANKEMKIRDINTSTDVVTSLSTDHNHLICAGCEDGVVRVFDDRQKSTNGQVFSFNDCHGAIVNAKIWPESYSDSVNIVSGSKNGHVCWYDKRFTSKFVRTDIVGQSLTAMNFHENTDVFACAFGNEYSSDLQLYTLDTMKGPSTKLRNRMVKHLAFHGLKAKFALLTNDGAVSIFKSSLRMPH